MIIKNNYSFWILRSSTRKILAITSSTSNISLASLRLEESDKKNIQKIINKLSIKDITDLISQNSNVPKKEIYKYCLKLKNEK